MISLFIWNPTKNTHVNILWLNYRVTRSHLVQGHHHFIILLIGASVNFFSEDFFRPLNNQTPK